MRPFSLRGAACALLLASGLFLAAAPADAHGRWNCGPRFAIGLDLFPPPPVYYAPAYAPAPVYYAPAPVYSPSYPPPVAVAAAPTIVQTGPTCTDGKWRQEDGSIVDGVACLLPNGTWKLAD
jgi:hypothetical protein